MSLNHIENIHYLNFDLLVNHSLFQPCSANEVADIVHDVKLWALNLFWFLLELVQEAKLTSSHIRKTFAD